MKEKKLEYIAIIVIFIFGLVFFMVGLLGKQQERIQTTAEILVIYPTMDTEGKTKYKLDIEYEVDGIKYNSSIYVHQSNLYEGENIVVYYNKDNPRLVGTGSSGELKFAMIFAGLFFMAICAGSFIVKLRKVK